MNKSELVAAIADKLNGITKKDIEAVLNALPEVVKETVANGKDVKLTGFLTFSKKDVPAKSGVSKLGGVEKAWSTEAKTEVSVKLSKSYKELA